jgi:DNA replication and repair protein RecF
MSLLNITLNNFRLHKNSSFDFCQGLNFIVGKNGTGKTSILEAIYYLCVSKSFYNVSDEEIANFESDYFDIKGIFNSDGKKKN